MAFGGKPRSCQTPSASSFIGAAYSAAHELLAVSARCLGLAGGHVESVG